MPAPKNPRIVFAKIDAKDNGIVDLNTTDREGFPNKETYDVLRSAEKEYLDRLLELQAEIRAKYEPLANVAYAKGCTDPQGFYDPMENWEPSDEPLTTEECKHLSLYYS